jgi:phosphatidylglycerophosphate synthase
VKPTKTAALILADAGRFLGMDLTLRTAIAASRAGIERLHIAGDHPGALAVLRQLDKRGIAATWTSHRPHPSIIGRDAEVLVVLDARTVVEPALLTELIERVRSSTSYVADPLSAGGATVIDVEAAPPIRGRFRGSIRTPHDIGPLERAYLSHTSGGTTEGFFTQQIRRWSIPLSRRLLPLSVSPNQVTLAGFALAVTAGLSFSIGGYWAGVAGALLYFVSTVLDCVDGEVARGSLSESRYGAWLETITDYLSYFAVLGGIVWGEVKVAGFCDHAKAAIVSGAASLAIVSIVGYLRYRIARENPGALDDALAAELKQGSPIQRFAGWSRHLIKRSFFAHLVVFQALIGHVPALTEIWAYGAVAALVLTAGVSAHLVQRVRVGSLPATHPSPWLEG